MPPHELHERLDIEPDGLAVHVGLGRPNVDPLRPEGRLRKPDVGLDLGAELLGHGRGVGVLIVGKRPILEVVDAYRHVARGKQVILWLQEDHADRSHADLLPDVGVKAEEEPHQRVPHDGGPADVEAELHAEGHGEKLYRVHVRVVKLLPPAHAFGHLLLHVDREARGDLVLPEISSQEPQLLVPLPLHLPEVHHGGGQRGDEAAAEQQAEGEADDAEEALRGVGALNLDGAQGHLRH
mmetsp:Transcript_37621/g.117236  ORF Transcript_37621/g.117236 Transcript_37621/m.117236 type:complete len:238 (-) Transcript_37621:344-1057(-)